MKKNVANLKPSASLLPLVFTIVAGGAAAQDIEPLPVVAEVNGLSADPSANSREALIAAVTAEDWAMPVEIINCEEAGCEGTRDQTVYTPLAKDEITQEWRICASLPHVKDAYWVAQNEGLVAEAERTGVSLQVYEAGGYTELSTQIDQISNCAASGADAILVGAISTEALTPIVEQLTADGIVVIDYINGINTSAVAGRALFNHCTQGANLGKYLRETGEDIKAVWLPGAAGTSTLELNMQCFREAASGGTVEVLATLYGDTGKDVQLNLVENALSAYPSMNYIVGSAVTLDAAAGPLAERGLTDKVKTMSYYLTPEVYDLLESGQATCASVGNDKILSRIAIDMAIRTLEGKPLNGGKHVGVPASVLCGPAAGEGESNLDKLVKELNLPSPDFSPVFSVN